MTTINKPLPHRPFSVVLDLEKAPRPRRHQPQLTSVSNLRPYVPANDKFTVPPVPKRTHLVTRSPSPPYYQPSPDVFPSSTKPSHSFSQSQSNRHHSSTSDLVPPHLKPNRSPSFWRRHWFVILISILALLGISVAVGIVLANGKRASSDSGVYIPPSISSISSASSVTVPISEAPIGPASVGSVTTSTASSVASVSGSTTSPSGTGTRTLLPSATSSSSRPS